MSPEQLLLLVAGIFLVALLYSSVGHAGASGYIAVMSLCGLAPESVKSTALVLNILVACVGSWQFCRAGHASWGLFWPFALLAAPLAFVGGYLDLPVPVFRVVVGVILGCAAVGLLVRPGDDTVRRPPPRPLAIAVGATIGLLAGLTGTGGGIFLTPLLLFARWARTKPAAATSALFILVNSIAGLLGNYAHTQIIPPFAGALAIAAIAGGAVGSYCGSRRFDQPLIKRLLAVVLLIAVAKLILGR